MTTMRAALEEALGAFASEFAADTEINGGDLLEWFSGWRERAKLALQPPKDDLMAALATVIGRAEAYADDWRTGVEDGTYDDDQVPDLLILEKAIETINTSPAMVALARELEPEAEPERDGMGNRLDGEEAWPAIVDALTVAASAPPEKRDARAEEELRAAMDDGIIEAHLAMKGAGLL